MMSRTVAMPTAQPSPLRTGREALRRWYEPRRSAYPWRGERDPYRVLVSEVMLQQTQVARVVAAYGAFLERFPTVASLARASRASVIRAWAGLGYNRRAVALSEAARAIAREHGGRVPGSVRELERLPGVGPYTAAAVASFAFGEPVAAVDINVRRVVARVHLGVDPHRAPTRAIAELADAWLERADPGAWNSALMDLGREVCRPRPRCGGCPLARACRYRAAGARGSAGPRRQGRFEGSTRQVRGALIRSLREHDALAPARLSEETGFDAGRVATSVDALVAEGLLERRPSGGVGLAS
jgi:A/G-specific adenine glycosylase